MAIQNRTVTIKNVFAKNANTTIPNPPVIGTSYRNTSLTAAEVGKGWPFKEIVDSAKFNEAMYEYTTICKQLETYGFLPWCASTNYEIGSLCLGTDGNIYQAKRNTGPSTTARNPVNDTNHEYWSVLLESIQLGIGDVKQSLRNANHGNWFLCNGQAISRTQYPILFSIIGTNFGAGNGTTTFNLPDYRGKFLRGLGGNSAANIYTTQAEGLPNITGELNYACVDRVVTLGAFNRNSKDSGSGYSGGNYKYIGVDFNASNSNPIYGASSHVTPINQAVNYFIRVG